MFRFILALCAGKILSFAIHVLGPILHKNGTHLPGNIALKIDPLFLRHIGKPETIVAVTGTNGKTTTNNLIIDALEKNGYKVLSNRYGSNVDSGIASALLQGVSLFNRPKFKLGILEVDERSSLRVYRYVHPKYVVVTNLMRDSLMRNAHPQYIFDIIEQALPDDATLILNADDLLSNRLKPQNPRIYYGIGHQPGDTAESRNLINDVQICPNCHSKLQYHILRYNSIGRAVCPHCGLTSPEADVCTLKIDREDRVLTMRLGAAPFDFPMISDSTFNIYNETAAVALLDQLGLSHEKIAEAFSTMQVVKSRYREDKVRGIRILSTMTKGWIAPACSAVFDYVSQLPGDKQLVLYLEDPTDPIFYSELLAYTFETDFEFLNKDNIQRIIVIGKRARDFYLRMLLAGIPEERLAWTETIEGIKRYLKPKFGVDIHILYDLHQAVHYEQIRANVIAAIEEAKL